MHTYSILLNLDDLETTMLESLSAIRRMNRSQVLRALLFEEGQRVLKSNRDFDKTRTFTGKIESEKDAQQFVS